MPTPFSHLARPATARVILLWLAGLALALLALRGAPSASAAAKVVGNGTPGSCSESALRTALSSGGSISFNCGGAVTIPITSLIEIAADTSIDGGGAVTLNGRGATRIFYVNKWEKHNGLRFELRRITLTGGRAGGSLDPTYGGCIYARRSVTLLTGVTMRDCQAPEAGGGLYMYGGEAIIEGGLYTQNRAGQGGAAHAVLGGKLTVISSTFSANSARGDGGAIYMGGSPLSIQGATFSANVAEGTTGKAYAGLGGAIYTNNAGATTTITTSAFTGNRASESGGAIFSDHYTVSTITSSTFSGNVSLPNVSGASGNGGVIGTELATVTIMNSELRGNQSNAGGAIFNGKGSTMTLSRSLVTANSSAGNGGGIYNIGATLQIADSSVTNNASGTPTSNDKQGGGLVSYSGSTVQVLRSTFSGNRATGANAPGGGIFVHKTTLTVKLSTITGNSAVRGGGIWHNGGTSSIVSSTIANNSATGYGANIGLNSGAIPPQVSYSLLIGAGGVASCNKPVDDKGHNIQFPDKSCGPNIPVANPQLGSLASNGGPTTTMALAADSPAINGGDSACDPLDQRSYGRSGACDIGAFEFSGAAPPNPSELPYHIYMPAVLR